MKNYECLHYHTQRKFKARFPIGDFVRANSSETKIRQFDWLTKMFASSMLPAFLFVRAN